MPRQRMQRLAWRGQAPHTPHRASMPYAAHSCTRHLRELHTSTARIGDGLRPQCEHQRRFCACLYRHIVGNLTRHLHKLQRRSRVRCFTTSMPIPHYRTTSPPLSPHARINAPSPLHHSNDKQTHPGSDCLWQTFHRARLLRRSACLRRRSVEHVGGPLHALVPAGTHTAPASEQMCPQKLRCAKTKQARASYRAACICAVTRISSRFPPDSDDGSKAERRAALEFEKEGEAVQP